MSAIHLATVGLTLGVLALAFSLGVLVILRTAKRCPECRAYDPMGRGPLGSWWHDEGCSHAGPFLSTGDDDE